MVERRLLEEIHAIHEFEPELRAVYVEGHSDQRFFEWYLRKAGYTGVRVYQISVIDIPSEVLQKYSLPKRSNKARLIALSREISGVGPTSGAMCIVDRDFNELCDSGHDNDCLYWTDGNSLELYAVQPNVFRKFLMIAIGLSSSSAMQFYSESVKILSRLYAIRSANEKLGWGMPDLSFRKYISKDGSCPAFDEAGFIRAYLGNGKKWKERAVFFEKLNEVFDSIGDDPMRRIRGHDLSELIYKLVGRSCRGRGFAGADTLESCLLATIESNELEVFALFKKLHRFSTSSDS